MTNIIIILIFCLFKVSYENNYNNKEKICYYMNILKKPIFFNYYILRNKRKNSCEYFIKKKKDKSFELFSLKDVLTNSLSDKDINEIKNIFPIINEKLLILDRNNFENVSNSEINDIDDLLIEFNNKHFNLKDIKVKIIDSEKNENDSYFNFVKDENDYLKKKVEILQSSPFNKTCFKSIQGNKCDNYKKNYENNSDVDEELFYELDETLNEKENSTIINGEEILQNINQKTENNENDGKSFYQFLKKFYLVNILSQNPMKIMYKYLEFKEYLSSSKEKLKNFFVKEYHYTTQKIISVLSHDLKKSNETGEENKNKNKGLLSTIFDSIFSLFYFPQKDVEL
ncbi:conserved Plasmodium protein, unknown function [Plasmodium gallinaceum]|uniref:Fam-b protein n=1 Tax=Plasmodium gallinaceum TaxID=5849 RepID=A0A1J1GNH5_PLAGA|nr:conserved Plasmodium protein, unknown function [Plasmodium gallinaceum]CRG93830.1 conserved Plasmodium protein, unknown function [Plasmodium gallinaceum]